MRQRWKESKRERESFDGNQRCGGVGGGGGGRRETESITFIKGRKRESGMLKQFEAVPRRCITRSHEVNHHQSAGCGVGGWGRRESEREVFNTGQKRDPVY